MRASSKRSSTSPASLRACSCSGVRYFRDVGEPVLDRLEHRRDRRDRRAEIVACGGDELAACIEEALEVRGHLVERAAELRELAGGRPRAHVQRARRRRAAPTPREVAPPVAPPSCRARVRLRLHAAAAAAATARIFTSSPMWEHDQAGEQHREQRQEHGGSMRVRRAGAAPSGGGATRPWPGARRPT